MPTLHPSRLADGHACVRAGQRRHGGHHRVPRSTRRPGLALAGRGLLDTTRLAASPSGIWQDIAATNADELREALDGLIAVLQELRADVDKGERLAEVFGTANRWRDTLKS